ncbi:MAG: helix-turn-helix transcriptional regulator [[Clostridium] sporosphaeroides]|uniref:Helix-turn-helix transcriptional regulator n=1 Tax=Faecalispora sporosphaeroides TaxID=1549 RepID=A0A928KTA1_9FIRM|nr:helix-turn-helix transcriptional regulator [Faecalispora sporosphaeroides]
MNYCSYYRCIRFTKVRQKKGLSQSELARRSGHAVSTIHGIENGDNQNPSFRTVCDIAKVLDIPLDELYQDVLNEKKHS